jgi:membrane-bound lytic murein transglycosylase A
VSGERILLTSLSGWLDDALDGALAAYRQSFEILRQTHRSTHPGLPAPHGTAARRYFEDAFIAEKISDAAGGDRGLFTGYYEPVLKGSRRRHGAYQVPLMGRPPDLVTLVDDALRASAGQSLTHGRQLADGRIAAYPTRQEIEQGAIDHMHLAFVYLEDPVDAFFLHVQGSGLIELNDGSRIRVSYAAKNGHPYTSLGAELIRLGEIAAEVMTLDELTDWLRADAERGRRFMWRNASYIFFEEIGAAEVARPVGVRGIPLTPGRSLAVDASLHAIGTPIFVVIDGLADPDTGSMPFARLMVAQDVGSAIRGAVRGDIFYGTGAEAGSLAGRTRHCGTRYRLVPKDGSSQD